MRSRLGVALHSATGCARGGSSPGSPGAMRPMPDAGEATDAPHPIDARPVDGPDLDAGCAIAAGVTPTLTA